MSSSSIDRRALRTRARLGQALLRLLARRPYEAITVEEICADAGVGRSTFYAHYAGKDELKRRGLDALQAELSRAATVPQREAPFGFCEAFFAHASAHRDHILALGAGRGAEVARERLRAIVTAEIRRDMLARNPEGARFFDFSPRVATAVAAFVGLFDWWLEEGERRGPAEMAALFRRVASEGFAA